MTVPRGWNEQLAASYDRVAERYATEFSGELDRKPFDREWLDQFADAVGRRGSVCDLGCGPGHVARYLRRRGVDVFGVDLSAGMIAVARRENRGIHFQRGDMMALPLARGALRGIASLYSVIHLHRSVVSAALHEMHRVLQPNGHLMLSFHQGEGELHADEFLGVPVAVDATLFESQEMSGYLGASGFRVERAASRPPYDFEYPTTRVYIRAIACKPVSTEHCTLMAPRGLRKTALVMRPLACATTERDATDRTGTYGSLRFGFAGRGGAATGGEVVVSAGSP